MEKYILTSTTYYGEKEITFYGVAFVEEENGKIDLQEVHNDLTTDRKRAMAIVTACNEDKVSASHLCDIANDMV